MTDEQRLAAYEAMQREIETLYADASARLERLKAQDKQKTASYREALGWKVWYKNVLELYARHGLAEKPE